MGTDTRSKVLKIAGDVLSVSPSALTENSSPKMVENWDSIRHLNLVLALEDSFALQFTPEEMEQMGTIGRIILLVEVKLGEAGEP